MGASVLAAVAPAPGVMGHWSWRHAACGLAEKGAGVNATVEGRVEMLRPRTENLAVRWALAGQWALLRDLDQDLRRPEHPSAD